jgi:DNA modification methylase
LTLNNYYVINPMHRNTSEISEITMQLNAIYCGDCAHVLAYFPEYSVDLIYIDPPFFSNRQYEIIWGNGYELRAFEDRWKGGIKNYIAWMEPKIRECHRILKPTGIMYLHCDWHANAHLRILMDKIFGEENFRNEIIWCYSGGGIPKKNFPSKHDTIFRYSKSNDYLFIPEYRPYSAGTLQRGRTQVKGKYYDSGLRKEGTPVPDWWTDIKYIHSPTDKEKLGYPTQKSEALLERIIKASSNPTDIVLDPMCGCGTAIAAAHKLGRRWIGIDVSPVACKVMVKRMQKLKAKIAESDVIGLPKSVEELEAMVPFEFQNWVIQKLYGRPSKSKVGDFGVDGWLTSGEPVQIKQSKDIGRNVVDNFETAIRRQGKKAGVIVAFSFGKGANEEVARAKQDEGLEIRLKKVKDLLK